MAEEVRLMVQSLPDGQLIPCSLLAIDVVGHSALVRQLSSKRVTELFGEIENRVRAEVEGNKGELLGWQGDGGIAVFHGSEHSDDEAPARAALKAADTILALVPVLSNQHDLRDDRALRVRVAVHSGTVIWRRDTGSIHSADVNFVAHLEHALPTNVIGLSETFYKMLRDADKRDCVTVGIFEECEVFIYARDVAARRLAVAAYELKRTESEIGRLCAKDGLVHLEFRDDHHTKLPPFEIYGQANSEILLSGITLAASFKVESSLRALRAAGGRDVRLLLLILDPKGVGLRFAKGLNSIEEFASALRDEFQHGRIPEGSVEVRGMNDYPHFTGIMIDGNAGSNLTEALPSDSKVLLRIQPTVPPEEPKSQHFASVFQYQKAQPSSTMMAFVRGFRYYWRNGLPLSLAEILEP
jgi:class 3 adenylate cyclase